MAAYSLDLRKRVLRAWDSGLDADSVAAKYEVSRAWVHRLVQRRRETGSIEPRKQTNFADACCPLSRKTDWAR
jgi:transposase